MCFANYYPNLRVTASCEEGCARRVRSSVRVASQAFLSTPVLSTTAWPARESYCRPLPRPSLCSVSCVSRCRPTPAGRRTPTLPCAPSPPRLKGGRCGPARRARAAHVQWAHGGGPAAGGGGGAGGRRGACSVPASAVSIQCRSRKTAAAAADGERPSRRRKGRKYEGRSDTARAGSPDSRLSPTTAPAVRREEARAAAAAAWEPQ